MLITSPNRSWAGRLLLPNHGSSLVLQQSEGSSLHICAPASCVKRQIHCFIIPSITLKPFTVQDLNPWLSWSWTLLYWSFQNKLCLYPLTHTHETCIKRHFSYRFTTSDWELVNDVHKLWFSSNFLMEERQWCGNVLASFHCQFKYITYFKKVLYFLI